MMKPTAKLDCLMFPGQKFYTIQKRTGPDVLLKAIKTEKFSKKVIVQQVICSCGFKAQLFFTNGNMNFKVYVKESLKKQLCL